MKNPMYPLLGKLLGDAAKLTQLRKLSDTTAVIQRALGAAGLLPTPRPKARPRPSAATTQRTRARAVDADVADLSARSGASSFTSDTFVAAAGTRQYKLFVPAGHAGDSLPLVVMLHGCTQDPDDFAAGTRMNALAQSLGVIVLYPAQAPRSNISKCWNWFQPGDQRRGRGEPALLAAMTRHIVATQPVDPARVYVAGLSAGGAMAAILGREYPELFAAVGVHSGLPPGAAHDVASAFSAMKNGPSAPAPDAAAGAPVIVFHGDRDTTVHPDNGEHVVGTPSGGTRHEQTGDAGRRFTQSVFTAEDGSVVAEHWVVHGAGHAWSGGSADGSYTDVRGPDASREMLRFFLAHPHPRPAQA